MLLWLFSVAHAAIPVDAALIGSVDVIDDPAGVLDGYVVPGEQITLDAWWTTGAPDTNPYPEVGSYTFTAGDGGVQLQLTGWRPQLEAAGSMSIDLWNDSALGDRFTLTASALVDPWAPELRVDAVELRLIDLYGGNILVDPVLPSCPPRIDQWSYTRELTVTGTHVPTGAPFSLMSVIDASVGLGTPQIETIAFGAAGQPSTFVLGCLSRGNLALLGVGRPGSTPVPGCPGVSVPVDVKEVVGKGVADFYGKLVVERTLTDRAAGNTFQMVAVDPDTCRASEVVTATP